MVEIYYTKKQIKKLKEFDELFAKSNLVNQLDTKIVSLVNQLDTKIDSLKLELIQSDKKIKELTYKVNELEKKLDATIQENKNLIKEQEEAKVKSPTASQILTEYLYGSQGGK